MYAMVYTLKFAEWLSNILEERGISQSELARQSGVTRAAINGILSGARGPGVDLCNGIANALNIPPEEVYRVAGLLPPQPEADILASTGLRILQKLKGERKSDAIRILEAQLKAQEETEKNAGRKRKVTET